MRIVIDSKARNLRNIKRFNLKMMLYPENDAEHLFYSAFYAYQIARDLQKRGYSIDAEHAAVKAMSHDLEEAASGDLQRDFKHYDPEFRRIVNERAQDYFFKSLNEYTTDEGLFELWKNAKNPETLEGRVVGFSDELEALVNLVEEAKLGNTTVHDKIQKQYFSMERRYGNDKVFGPYVQDAKVYAGFGRKKRKV